MNEEKKTLHAELGGKVVLPTPNPARSVKTVNGKAPDENGNVNVSGGGEVDPEAIKEAVDEYLLENPPAQGAPGKDGADGKDGVDGKTPVKGVDYFTPEEVQEIAEQAAGLVDIPEMPDIPEALPNPNAITFTGAVNAVYDGSQPVSVEIPSGGGSGDVWEELVNVTTTAEVGKVFKTLETAGKFKKLSFYLQLKGTSTNTGNGGIAINVNDGGQYFYNNGSSLFGVDAAFGTSNVSFYGIIHLTPTHAVSVWKNNTTLSMLNSGSYGYCTITTNVNQNTVISSIVFGTQNFSKMLGVGSIVKVYGVRA